MKIIKRSGSLEDFDLGKILKAANAAYNAAYKKQMSDLLKDRLLLFLNIDTSSTIGVEEIQNKIEDFFMNENLYKAAKKFILYRETCKQTRDIQNRIDYMVDYENSSENPATCSNTDPNANVTVKNAANLDGEVYKDKNRNIQRRRMKIQLEAMFPEVSSNYKEDLKNHIIYVHDEATIPTLKPYCMAVSLYPLMTEGVGNIDGITPSAPDDMLSFSGQLTNLIFLLSSQCKGAVAVGEYFVALNYYIIAEYGSKWYEKVDVTINNEHCLKTRTIKDMIEKAFKQFVWGINQPAGNRGYQSPFVNISYFDKTYFKGLFENFYYPDSTQPEWKAIDTLQKMFMKWFNKLRLKQVLTFPVETLAMVHNGKDVVDQDYKNLDAEMYAEGHSFFTYMSNSPDSLSSCCRLRNELSENTFSPTSGLTGIMTGSCNVISLNFNRIIQDWVRMLGGKKNLYYFDQEAREASLKEYIIDILDRVYKYHIAYKTMLYDQEEKGMFTCCTAGYIHINKLYSTIGINGHNEAARFLGLEVSNNGEYFEFLQFILSIIKEQNKLHNIYDKKRPFLFNSEVVPAEGLGVKNYNWDKEDGYWVPEDENLYNSYFYNAHNDTSVLDKFILHGRKTCDYTDGGSAAHINLEDHLSKEQYLTLIDFAIQQGTNYFTFNIPNSKCEDCGHIVKRPFDICPKCGSTNVTQYTRVIGYLRPIKSFSKDRQIEAAKRVYKKEIK